MSFFDDQHVILDGWKRGRCKLLKIPAQPQSGAKSSPAPIYKYKNSCLEAGRFKQPSIKVITSCWADTPTP